jgi:transketolase
MTTTTDTRELDELCVNTIRTLSMDAVQKANSGHPGAPMALAPLAYVLYTKIMKHDPDNPEWFDRDRFVLSAGHASMLLYSILHLSGYGLSMDDLKNFRQLLSPTAGHPEYEAEGTPGVEVTTGPLGQGLSNAVGFALAERMLAARFNREGFDVIDHHTYAIASDGDIQEGVTSEASSLAGHLGLGRLIAYYDDNKIQLASETKLVFSEDVAKRYEAYGWHVQNLKEELGLDRLEEATRAAQAETDRPSLIIMRTHIGYGSPNKQDSHSAHGEPLGEEEIRLTKRNYGWPEGEKFRVPEEVLAAFREGIGARGGALRKAWMERFEAYKKEHPELADQLYRMQHRQLPEGWDKDIPKFPADAKGLAGRDASAKVLNAIAKNVPWLIGGSADLAPSTKTRLTFEGAGTFLPDNPHGRNFHFGVREHAMASVLNGLSLSKIRPFGSGFLIFSDYARPAIRLSAIMEIPVIHIFTHDSIGVGEDGPTHQPIEQLASLRAIPGLVVLRPADANEVAEAWRVIMQMRHHPAVLVLSRQALPTMDRSKLAPAVEVARGAYVLADAEGGKPDVILIGTGSEIEICVRAHETLTGEGIKSRVVSMPSWELFEEQSPEYRETVLPRAVTARVAVEKGATFGWARYVGTTGHVVGMTTFGASAPLKELQKRFGFTAENVVAMAKEQLK